MMNPTPFFSRIEGPLPFNSPLSAPLLFEDGVDNNQSVRKKNSFSKNRIDTTAQVTLSQKPEKPIGQIEKEYASLFISYQDLVGRRISIAQMASTLDLPDNSIFILMKAYNDVQTLFDDLIKDLNGRAPSSAISELLGQIKLLKIMVLTQVQNTLAAHGGPKLSLEELDAMLAPEKMANPKESNPNAPTTEQKLTQDFMLFSGKKGIEKLTQSATNAIAQKIPEIIQEILSLFQSLKENPNGGIGFARVTVNRILTRLEMVKALTRIAMVPTNSFKSQAVDSTELTNSEGQLSQLESMAKQVFRQFEERSFANAREVAPTGQSNMTPESLNKTVQIQSRLLSSFAIESLKSRNAFLRDF